MISVRHTYHSFIRLQQAIKRGVRHVFDLSSLALFHSLSSSLSDRVGPVVFVKLLRRWILKSVCLHRSFRFWTSLGGLQVDSILLKTLYILTDSPSDETLTYALNRALLQHSQTMAEVNHTEVYVYEKVLILLSCALSFLGSLLIIWTYARWVDLRTKPRKLLVYLSVADLLSALSYSYGVWRDFETDSVDCITQGAISTFANTSSFFWTVAIAIYLYMFIVRSSQRQADNLVLYFHLIRWLQKMLIVSFL